MNRDTILAHTRMMDAKFDFIAARLRYLAAMKALEVQVYRKDYPTLCRKQA